jgi:hypothetical protein
MKSMKIMAKNNGSSKRESGNENNGGRQWRNAVSAKQWQNKIWRINNEMAA